MPVSSPQSTPSFFFFPFNCRTNIMKTIEIRAEGRSPQPPSLLPSAPSPVWFSSTLGPLPDRLFCTCITADTRSTACLSRDIVSGEFFPNDTISTLNDCETFNGGDVPYSAKPDSCCLYIWVVSVFCNHKQCFHEYICACRYFCLFVLFSQLSLRRTSGQRINICVA